MRSASGALQLALVLSMAFATPGLPQASPPAHSAPRPCEAARHREFDFLLGTWEAFTPDGQLAGRDRIARVYDGCALEEKWSGPAEPPKYRGGSLSAFDARNGRWHQTWVDTLGAVVRLDGGIRDGRMVLEGEAGAGPAGRRVRLTWEPLAGGEVRQTIENNGGPEGAWQTAVVFHYRRAGAATIPLRYDERLTKAGFPSPAVRLTVGGRTAWFLVDSGAGVSTFAAWFVRSAGLPSEETSTTMRDASGRAVPFRVVRNVMAALSDGSELKIETAGITDFPALFETNELGGLLSPQLLAPEGLAATLDLRVPELRFEPFEAALARLGAQRLSEAKVCEVTGADLKNRLYAIPATLAGTSTFLLLDSGATDTEVLRDSAPARALAGKMTEGGRTMGISGSEEERLRAPGTPVEFAGAHRTLDVSIGAATSPCAPDGLLGIDALRGCAMVLGAGEVGMMCDPSAYLG